MSRIVLILLILSSIQCFSQTLYSNGIRKARLLTEIKHSDRIESYCLGYACNVSKLCLKVDSLFEISNFVEIVSFFDDTSYVLKYYAFEKIASESDSLAYEKLKTSILDSTSIFTHFSCVMAGYNYNELLVKRYAGFVKFRYFYGLILALIIRFTIMGSQIKKYGVKREEN